MLANKPRFRPWPRRPRPQKGSGPRFILHFFMCFIVARCPGRSVLKAVRRLKPEKPTKRLLTRRWRTIRISKGQLSLPYLTLPAKEIRLGAAIPPLAISSFYFSFFSFFPFLFDPRQFSPFQSIFLLEDLLCIPFSTDQCARTIWRDLIKIRSNASIRNTEISRVFSYISNKCHNIFHLKENARTNV